MRGKEGCRTHVVSCLPPSPPSLVPDRLCPQSHGLTPACMLAPAANMLFPTRFLGRHWQYRRPCMPYFFTCCAPGWGGRLPFRKLPPFCLYIEITCQAISSLGSPRLPLFVVSVITQHFIPRVLLPKGKLQKGGGFSVPLTCYRVCPEACLAEGKLSKILLGERDGKPGQASIGNGSETGTLLGLGFACLPLSMMQLAPPACYLRALCAPPSFNNGDSILGPPPAMAGIGFSSPNNNPT